MIKSIIACLAVSCLLLISIVGMQGCAKLDIGEYQPPQACLNANGTQKESVILDRFNHPRETSLVLKLATVETIKHSLLTKAEVKEFLEQLLRVFTEEVTYAEFYSYVASMVDWANDEAEAEIVILSQYFRSLQNIEQPITTCDVALIKKHLREQIDVVKGMR